MGKPCQSLLIDAQKQQAFDILEWDNLVKFCSLILEIHAFDIFEWDALCCQQRQSIFSLFFSCEVNIASDM